MRSLMNGFNKLKKNIHKQSTSGLAFITGIVLVCTLISILGISNVRLVFAQLESAIWTEPVNVSHSGSTSDPRIVIDDLGTLHVVWLDGFTGTTHASLVDREWTAPRSFTAPFVDIVPQFVSDDSGYIHAFWIETDLSLMYSRIQASSFGNQNAWSAATQLDLEVIKFSVEVGSENQLHVAYVRNVDVNREAGIYYINSFSEGVGWNQPVLLYSSNYLRLSDPATANVQVTSNAVGDSEQVYVAWDERQRKRIYLIGSSDSGATWGGPQEIDQPNISNPQVQPQNIRIASNDNGLVLFWEDGNRDEFSCRFYSQTSQDQGITWSNRNAVEIGVLGCLDDSQMDLLDDGNALFIGRIQNQITFLAWNGATWSEAQPQTGLSRFTNQDTLTPLTLGCINLSLAKNILYLVGCDQGGSGDIWMSIYSLEATDKWFNTQMDWNTPALIQQSTAGISFPSVIVDLVGNDHVLWSELEVNPDNSVTSRLGYAVKNGSGWSQPIFVSRSLEGNTAHVDSIIDVDGNLLAAWSGGEFGDIYFIEADAQRANNLNEWSLPALISLEKSLATSPVIQVDQDGVVYIAFGIAVNEERGVYFSKFDRGNQELEGPSLVYDASLEGYEIVSDVSFTRDAQGNLFISWIQKPVEPDVVAGGDLYFIISYDNGLTWSAAEKFGYDNVVWSHLAVQDDQTVHLFYQEIARVGFYGLKHMYSMDRGISWSTPTDVLSHIGESPGYFIPVLDHNAGLHLLRAYTEERSDRIIVQELGWKDQDWEFESDASFPIYDNGEIIGIDGWAAGDKIVLVYAVKEQQYITAPANYFLYSTERRLEISSTTSAPTPEGSPTDQLPEAPTAPVTTQSTEAGSSQNETPTPVPSSDLAEVLMPELTSTATAQPGGSRLPGFFGDYGVGLAIGGAVTAIVGIVVWMRRRNLGRGK